MSMKKIRYKLGCFARSYIVKENENAWISFSISFYSFFFRWMYTAFYWPTYCWCVNKQLRKVMGIWRWARVSIPKRLFAFEQLLTFNICFLFNLKVVRPFFMTDRLVVKLKEKENALHCVYLNDFNMVTAAFVLQSNEAKNWYDGINKARHIYIKLKQDVESVRVLPHQQGSVNSYNITDNISIKKSPLGSSIGKMKQFNQHCRGIFHVALWFYIKLILFL